jgi:hypothetical protein
MKIKRKPFIQHLAHEVEDEDKAWDYLDESLPNVGRIVMYFNGLEKLLDQMLCETFSDRSDTTGLIVLQNMQYSAKVNLFSRFSDDLHRAFGDPPKPYEKLLDRLREAAKQRNIVVHADWENTDDNGYTYSTIRFADGGMQQEYIQLTTAALESIVETILAARKQLGEYWEAKSEMLERWNSPRMGSS